MTIFRGAGGGGASTSSAELSALTAISQEAAGHAEASANSAAQSAASVSLAADQANAAAASAASASTSAANALSSANTASSHATAADGSKTAAATSASNAATSASQAATSATEAATSAAAIDPATLVRLSGNQTISGVKTFNSTIQASISGSASSATTAGNVTGIVAVANGGTGASSSDAAPFALKGANTDITSLSALSSVNGGQLAGLRNKVINGKMEVAQRGTSFTAIASGAYSVDRWAFGNTSAAVLNATQQSGAPSSNEFQYSLQYAVTTADTSIAAGDVCWTQQKIEGFNARDLIGRTFTLSFWVRSAKTGVHCVSFSNGGGATDRSYVVEYTVSAANTWEYKTVTVSGGLITAGNWNWTNGVGLRVQWALASGSTYNTTAGAWQTGDFYATANQVNCLDTVGNVFAMTGVQLEVGSVATPFEHRPYGAELALCQRYYELTTVHIVCSYGLAGVSTGVPVYWAVEKRVAPTVVYGAETVSSNASSRSTDQITTRAARSFVSPTATGGVLYSANLIASAEL